MSGTYKSYKGRRKTGGRRRSAYTAGIRRGTPSKTPGKTEIKLIVCLLIAAVFSIARLVFPDAFAQVRGTLKEYVGGSVDLKSAVAVIGEAINGEKEIAEAFSEAYGYAFGINHYDEDTDGEFISVMSESADEERV